MGISGRALVINLALIPIVGVVPARLVPMRLEVMAALVLLACAPGEPSALQFTSKRQTALAHAAATASARFPRPMLSSPA